MARISRATPFFSGRGRGGVRRRKEYQAMELLKDRIRRDGKVKGTDVLKVDSFLNHQMDVELFAEIGKEFKRRFAGDRDRVRNCAVF